MREVHHSILDTYRDDFNKYSSGRELVRLQKLFEQFPSVIGNKIKYSSIAPDEPARDIRGVIDLLDKARVLRKVLHSDCSGLPLAAQADEFVFKLFFLDVGLVCAATGLEYEAISSMGSAKLLSTGNLTEQFVHQNLLASKFNEDQKLFYWLREGKSQNAEVDFVSTVRGHIVPIEVKAGKSGTMRSLHQFVAKNSTEAAVRFDLNLPSVMSSAHQVVTNEGTVAVKYDLISLPVYLACELYRILETKH